MNKNVPSIFIKPQSNHNALFLILLAIILFMLTLAMSQHYWRQFHLVLTFIYLAELVVFITGLAKYFQPKFSLTLTPSYIKYQHRFGQWQLNWQDIQRISLMNETLGINQLQLPFIGIRLTTITALAASISPRLANRLIHEQRPLLAIAIRLKLITFAQSQLNFSPFILANGQIIKGPLAAFMHHSSVLHEALGYHLFIPESALDRDLNTFCVLLNQCKQSTHNYE
jgi:hypothetical protein